MAKVLPQGFKLPTADTRRPSAGDIDWMGSLPQTAVASPVLSTAEKARLAKISAGAADTRIKAQADRLIALNP